MAYLPPVLRNTHLTRGITIDQPKVLSAGNVKYKVLKQNFTMISVAKVHFGLPVFATYDGIKKGLAALLERKKSKLNISALFTISANYPDFRFLRAIS